MPSPHTGGGLEHSGLKNLVLILTLDQFLAPTIVKLCPFISFWHLEDKAIFSSALGPSGLAPVPRASPSYALY